MVKILGLGDLIAVGLLVATAYHVTIPQGLVISISVYLFLKGLVFFFDIGSWFDIIAGIILILSLSMVIHPILLYVIAVLVGIKSVLSFFA